MWRVCITSNTWLQEIIGVQLVTISWFDVRILLVSHWHDNVFTHNVSLDVGGKRKTHILWGCDISAAGPSPYMQNLTLSLRRSFFNRTRYYQQSGYTIYFKPTNYFQHSTFSHDYLGSQAFTMITWPSGSVADVARISGEGGLVQANSWG